jgi:hypothetical protein
MKLLSIDVGIKNLAYCLFDTSLNVAQNVAQNVAKDNILLWGVINLCGAEPNCGENCKKKAKFAICNTSDMKYFCPTHAKKSTFILPTNNLSLKKIKTMKLVDLHKVVKEYNIPLAPEATKKEDILKTVQGFMEKQMLQPVSQTSANALDLIQLGIAMRKAFDEEFKDHLATIDCIIIENQISPIANRMKSLQGMLAQYFIMHDKTQIVFVSAANKLKGYASAAAGAGASEAVEANEASQIIEAQSKAAANEAVDAADTSSYAARKKEGIRITLELLTANYSADWLAYFKTHKKKDDLADAFLQGKWYINKLI